MKTTMIAAIAAATLGTASAEAASLIAVDTSIGEVIAAAENGRTLYTFRNDARNNSNCYDGCAQSWPPFEASAYAAAEGALKVIERRDGTLQWALNGKPLYFWAGDQKRGDATGDGVGGVWDVVRR